MKTSLSPAELSTADYHNKVTQVKVTEYIQKLKKRRVNDHKHHQEEASDASMDSQIHKEGPPFFRFLLAVVAIICNKFTGM